MKLRLLLALAILAVSAAPAAAADHEFTLSAATAQHQWVGAVDVTRGSPVNNPETREQLGCATPLRPCEEVLIKVEEAGKFTATVTGQPSPAGEQLTTDVDAWLYKSDASGAYQQGESIAAGTSSGPDSVTFAKAVPGFYLLVVDYYNAYGSGYDGVLKFTPAAPAAAPAAPAPVVTPPAAAPPKPAAKKPSKKAACQKKAKKIKNKKKRAKALKKCKKAKR